jgi:hypothetical protein
VAVHRGPLPAAIARWCILIRTSRPSRGPRSCHCGS